MRKTTALFIASGLLVASLTGCADTPEKSIVREKNMDKMLEDAKEGENNNSYDQLKEEVKKYEKYQKKFTDKNLKVSVDIDAKVEIPEAEKLSVYRVHPTKIDQATFDKIRTALSPNTSYYDGAGIDEDSPNIKKLVKSPSDHKIKKIKKMHEDHPGDTFYDWLYELHKNGEFYYGLSDKKDGNYHTLYMQNSENYGNCLRYKCSKNIFGIRFYHADVENDIQDIVPAKDNEAPDFTETGISFDNEEQQTFECAKNEPLTLSQKEAEQKAAEFLKQIGFNDFHNFSGGKYSQLLTAKNSNGKTKITYRDVYHFLFLRKLDGVFVNNQAGFKLTDEWQGDNYTKKMWGSEAIAININDNGIADFFYLSPLTVDDTVVKTSKIKPFSEIKEIFEQMVVIDNAPEDLEQLKDEKVSIHINEVHLAYTRISEKNSFDSGLVVPVWNFEGTVMDEYGKKDKSNGKNGIVLSVNAIDGSVINYDLGY